MSNKGNKKVLKNVDVNKNIKAEKKQTTFLLLFLIVFVVIFVGTVFGNCMQIYENRRATEEYNEYYNRLLEEEASLNSEVIKLQDPDYVARYARERYGYSKDGEKILTLVDGQVVATNSEK